MEVVSSPTEVRPVASDSVTSLSLGSAWGYLFLLLALMLIGGGGIALALSQLTGLAYDDPAVTLIGYVVPFIFYSLILKSKGNLAPLIKPAPGQQRVPVLLYLLIVLLIPSIQIVIEPLTSLIPMPDSVKELFESRLAGKNVFTILTVVVAAPILEEFVLRGHLLRSMLRAYSPTKAIIWTSIMFAVIHMNPWQGIGAFALGLFLGWIYYRTRSLWACIFFHFANNLFSSIMSWVTPEGTDKFASLYDQIGDATMYAFVYGAAAVVLVLCVVLMQRMFQGFGAGAESVRLV